MFGAKLNHKTKVFVDSYDLTGVTSVSISANQSNSVLTPIGTTRGSTLVSGPPNQQMSFSRSLIYSDPIFEYLYTSKPMKAGVLDFENDSFYSFESGFLKTYSVNCAVGASPKVNASFNVFDEIKSGEYSQFEKKVHNKIDVPNQSTINIESSDFGYNRVVGFDYSVSIDQKVLYSIGSTSPTSLVNLRPFRYSATVQLELEQSYDGGSFDFLRSREDRNISLDIEGRKGTKIQSFSMPNASLVGTNVSQSSQGLLKVDLSYIGTDGEKSPLLP